MFHDLSIVISEDNNLVLRDLAYFPDLKGNKKVTREIYGVSAVLKFICKDTLLKPDIKVRLLESALQLIVSCYPKSEYKEKAKKEILEKLTGARNILGLKKLCLKKNFKFVAFKNN